VKNSLDNVYLIGIYVYNFLLEVKGKEISTFLAGIKIFTESNIGMNNACNN
jgi:hypothetical protein